MANLDIIIRAVDQASGTIDGIGGKMTSLAGTATKLVAGAGVAAFGALSAAIGVSVSKAADMEQRVADIASVMGLAKDATQPLADLITDLGLDPKLKVSAVEAADAIESLATGGVSMTDILDGAARSTVLLANSTGADFGQAATIATDVMALFNIGAQDMMHAVDGITGVTVASKFGINDYALALAQGGGVASAVGVSFEDFNTTIAAISPYFSSGSDAGTSFKTFLQRLVPTTDSARGAMAELGLITADGSNAFFDSAGNMKDMQEIAGLLQGAIGGLSEEQKNQYLSTIFGTDAMRAAVGLAEAGSGTFDTLAASIASTSAEMSAATRMDTFKGAWEIMTGVIDTLAIELGNVFLPVFRDVIEWLTALAQNYGPAAIAWVEDMIGWVQDIIPVITKWGDTLWDALQEVKDWVSGSDEQMVILKGLWDGVIAFLEDKLPEWAGIVGEWASEAYLWLVDVAAPEALEAIGKYAGALIDYLTANAPAWVNTLAGWADAAWKWIIDIALPTAVEKLGAFAQGLFSWMTDHLPGWLAVLRDWAVAAAVWILDAAADLLTHAATVLGKLTDWIGGEGQGNLGSSLVSWVSAMWRWVEDELWPKLEPALNALGDAMLLLLGSIGELLWSAVKSLGANLVSAIQAGIEEAWDAFKTWLSTTWDTIAEPVRKLGETFKELGGALLQGFRNGISDAWDNLVIWWDGLWGSLVDHVSSIFDFGSPSKVFYDFGQNVLLGWSGGWQSEEDAVISQAGETMAKLIGATTEQARVSSFRSLGQEVLQAFGEGWNAWAPQSLSAIQAWGSGVIAEVGQVSNLTKDAIAQLSSGAGQLMTGLVTQIRSQWTNQLLSAIQSASAAIGGSYLMSQSTPEQSDPTAGLFAQFQSAAIGAVQSIFASADALWRSSDGQEQVAYGQQVTALGYLLQNLSGATTSTGFGQIQEWLVQAANANSNLGQIQQYGQTFANSPNFNIYLTGSQNPSDDLYSTVQLLQELFA